MENQQNNIKMQSESNSKAAQAASQGRMQELQMKSEAEAKFEQMKSQLDMQKMQAKMQLDSEILKIKHQFDLELKQLESDSFKEREGNKEDRKDKRTEKQATQQSKLIKQRKDDTPAVDFESEGSGDSIIANIRARMGGEGMM